MPIPANSGFAGVVNTPTSQATWASKLLRRLGLPSCQNNITSIVGWQNAEGGTRGGAFNPLNTKRGMPGDSVLPNGIHRYTSEAQGIDATAQTLLQSAFGYPAIVGALRRCAPPAETMSAIASSQWGTTASDLQSGFATAARTNGSDPVSNAFGAATDAVGSAVTAPINAAESVGQFLGNLSNPKLWLRIVYVVGGAGLIALSVTAAIRGEIASGIGK